MPDGRRLKDRSFSPYQRRDVLVAHDRLDQIEDENAELRRRIDLLAAATGVDLKRLAILDRISSRGGLPTTWDEMAALGVDPLTGRPT